MFKFIVFSVLFYICNAWSVQLASDTRSGESITSPPRSLFDINYQQYVRDLNNRLQVHGHYHGHHFGHNHDDLFGSSRILQASQNTKARTAFLKESTEEFDNLGGDYGSDFYKRCLCDFVEGSVSVAKKRIPSLGDAILYSDGIDSCDFEALNACDDRCKQMVNEYRIRTQNPFVLLRSGFNENTGRTLLRDYISQRRSSLFTRLSALSCLYASGNHFVSKNYTKAEDFYWENIQDDLAVTPVDTESTEAVV